MKRNFAFTTTLILTSWLPLAADYRQHEDLKDFVDELVSEHAFDAATVTSAFEGVYYKPKIVATMKSPAESISWFKYRNIFMQRKRIDDGVKFIRVNKKDLDKAFEEFQIPAHIIAAVIGVETNYGSNMGSVRVIDALATLGFDYPPRASFFRNELKQFLVLACEERIKPFDTDDACDREHNNLSVGEGRTIYDLVGSYAGAMGYGQFIPSSYRNFAIDFDADGVRDIWSNITDAIGSVANYFAKHQWTAGGRILEFVDTDAFQALLAEYANTTLQPSKTIAEWQALAQALLAEYANTTLQPSKTIAEWQALGIKSEAPSNLSAALFAYKLDDKEPPTLQYMLGFDNFYSITRYNHSRLYARVVYELAEAIRKKL